MELVDTSLLDDPFISLSVHEEVLPLREGLLFRRIRRRCCLRLNSSSLSLTTRLTVVSLPERHQICSSLFEQRNQTSTSKPQLISRYPKGDSSVEVVLRTGILQIGSSTVSGRDLLALRGMNLHRGNVGNSVFERDHGCRRSLRQINQRIGI